jgi:hypothetical protein
MTLAEDPNEREGNSHIVNEMMMMYEILSLPCAHTFLTISFLRIERKKPLSLS